jgi:hypothetical protein
LGGLGPDQSTPTVWTPEAYYADACFQLAPGTRAVSVVDDLGGSPAYFWSLGSDDGFRACGSGDAQGGLVVEITATCNRLEIDPYAGSVSGTITVR